MDVDELLAGFEECTIAADKWDHKAHICVAYEYLRRNGFDEALVRMRRGLQRFLAAKGIEDQLDRGYHETVTQAWLRIVGSTMRVHGCWEDAEAFCVANPHLLSRTLLRVFYSRERLLTMEAKQAFVPPDLAPLPTVPPTVGK